MAKIVIIIPTYNPTNLLVSTLKDLNSYPELRDLDKLIINDGSAADNPFLEEIKKDPKVRLINHSLNLGKGAAIKTAVKHIIDGGLSTEYIVTVDSDGQHLGRDVVVLLESVSKNGDGVHIGFRRLEKTKTPMRSFVGNLFSRKLFALLHSYELQDTQSGLRVYSRDSFPIMLSCKSDRYEFEMEAIIGILKNKIRIHEAPIETVYFNKNRSSHFRPLADSSRVIWVIIKFWFTRNN